MGEGVDDRNGIVDAGDSGYIETLEVQDDVTTIDAPDEQVLASRQTNLPPALRYIRRQFPRIAPWAMATSALILIAMLTLLFTDTHAIDAATRPTPTATPAPTATEAPTATPAPIDGFQFYRDPANHYIIQYPLGWVVSSDNTSQGIEFCDDCTNPGYIVQVDTPSNLADVGPPANQNSAADWVTYALNGLASRLQSGTLTPLGEQQPITIGGVVWQSGSGLVTDSNGGARFRVQVYATVHDGKPYILVLSTTEDRFTAGTIQFFGPMLQSFEFVTQAP
jgi:photosystem II reaction center protein PsbP